MFPCKVATAVGILARVKRVGIALALTTLCVLPPAFSTDSPERAGYHLLLARLLAAEDEPSEAASNFVRALELSPADPFLRLEYCKFLLQQRRPDKAAQQAAAARRLAPDDADVLRVFVETQMKLIGQVPSALTTAREALEHLRGLAPEDVDSMVTLGQIYLSEKSPERAAEVFQEIIDRTSGNRMVYSLLVDALTRSGQGARAEETLRQALRLDPSFTRARIVLADLLAQDGRHREAVDVLSDAPESEARDLDLRKRMALEKHRTGDLEGALAEVDEVLRQEPDYFAGLYLKTLILSMKGMNSEATELAQRLVVLNPESLEVAVLLSQLLERQQRVDEALRVLEDVEQRLLALDQEPLAEQARLQHAIVLARAERWEQLASELEPRLPDLEESNEIDLVLLYAEAQARIGNEGKAVAILSRFDAQSAAGRAALAKRAEVFFRLGQEDRAERSIDELRASGQLDDLVRAAEVYQRLERYVPAIPLLEEALERDPGSIQVMFWLGASYERTGRTDQAEAILEELLRIDPEFAPALNYLGYMWAEKGQNLERALSLVRQAVALEPGNGAYVDSLGWTHFQLGQYDEARSYLERAVGLVGQDAIVFEHLGDLYVVLGRLQEARDMYQRALALNAENAGQVQEKLDRLPGDL